MFYTRKLKDTESSQITWYLFLKQIKLSVPVSFT